MFRGVSQVRQGEGLPDSPLTHLIYLYPTSRVNVFRLDLLLSCLVAACCLFAQTVCCLVGWLVGWLVAHCLLVAWLVG